MDASRTTTPGAAGRASYVDDLMSGRVNIMDATTARETRAMRGTARGVANARAEGRAARGRASGCSGDGGGDGDGGRGGSGRAADETTARGRAREVDFALDDLFSTGGGSNARADGERERRGGASATSADLLGDFFGGGASETSSSRDGRARATEALIRHDADDNLIDGLDALLGEVSIASSPRVESPERADGTFRSPSLASSTSRSTSQTMMNDFDDVLSSSAEVEPTVGLARFRSAAIADPPENARAARETNPPPKPSTTTRPEEISSTSKLSAKLYTASSTASSVEDLDDFFSAGAAKSSSPSTPAATSSVDPIEAMFTVPSAGGSSGASVPVNGVVDDLFGAMDTRATSQPTSASSGFEYKPDEDVDPNEPPERAALRAARHERNRQRIEQALKEKRARESAARQEQSERQMLKDLIGADIDAWQKKNQNNIRTMLANLGDVLWEGHRYKAPDMATLMQPTGVKKSYHRALVVIHPDKVSQAGGDASQRYIADKVFDIMKMAYKDFEAKELK